jgi:hypothetical protein
MIHLGNEIFVLIEVIALKIPFQIHQISNMVRDLPLCRPCSSVRAPLRSEALIEYCMRSGVFWVPPIELTIVPLTAHTAHAYKPNAQRCTQLETPTTNVQKKIFVRETFSLKSLFHF